MTTESAVEGSRPGPPLSALLTQARDIIVKGLHDELAEEGFEGIRPVHGSVFRNIDPEGSRLTTLAERAGLTKQAIGELIDDLQRLGYLERVVDEADRRAKIIRLTGQGRLAQTTARRILVEIERGWARLLGEERAGILRRSLEEVIAADAAGTAPGG